MAAADHPPRGQKHFVEFNRGKVVDRLTRDAAGRRGITAAGGWHTEKRGTELHFMADEEIFGEVEFHYEIIAKRLRELSFLNNGVKIRLMTSATARKRTLPFSGGVKGFVEYINRTSRYCIRTSSMPAGNRFAAMARSASKWPCNGTTATPNRFCVSPTTSRRLTVERT
jgi:DNA gyrase subunit B